MLEKYIDLLIAGSADLVIKTKAETVRTAAWTVYRCRFGCSSYGKRHCCPPDCPSWKETQEMIDCFQYGILFRCHKMSMVTPLAVKVAKELFLDDFYKVIAFGSGPCRKCNVCNPDHCNFPGKTIPSMEACGIDVFATVRNNGIELHTLQDENEVQNHSGLILVE